MTDACSDIVSVLRTKQGNSETEDLSASVQEYVTELRREDLVDELQQHGLTLESDDTFCQKFKKGKTEACVQEVVATTALSEHLQTMRCWEHNYDRVRSVMQKRYCSGECDNWYDAFESVKALIDYTKEDSDSDSDADYDCGDIGICDCPIMDFIHNYRGRDRDHTHDFGYDWEAYVGYE